MTALLGCFIAPPTELYKIALKIQSTAMSIKQPTQSLELKLNQSKTHHLELRTAST